METSGTGWPPSTLRAEEWEDILTEDEAHPYHSHPLTYPTVTPGEGDSDVVPSDRAASPFPEANESSAPGFGTVNPNTYQFLAENV